jgi:hypothetical protein
MMTGMIGLRADLSLARNAILIKFEVAILFALGTAEFLH